MAASVAIAVLYFLLFTAILYRWRFFHLQGIPKTWVTAAFLLKCVAGIAFWLVYHVHYTASEESDAFRYFNDAMLIREQWHDNRDVFWSLMSGREDHSVQYAQVYERLVGWHSGYRYGLTNDCRTIIRLNVLIGFISFGSYHVHWLVMAFLAFTGLTALFHAFVAVFKKHPHWLFVACFLLPSVVFWSAGLLKEGPTMLGVGFLFLGLQRWMQDHRAWQPYVLITASSALVIFMKEYVWMAMLPAIAFLVVVKLSGRKKILLKFVCTQILCFAVAQHAHHFFIGGDFLYVVAKKKTDFENTSLIKDAGSAIHIPDTHTTTSFLIHYPEAFALSYLRPWLWESQNILYLPFALENLLYAGLTLLTLVCFRKPHADHWPLLLAALSFVLVLASIIGNCVPVLGSIVRYRIAALPLLVIVCLACIDPDRFRWRSFSRKPADSGKVS